MSVAPVTPVVTGTKSTRSLPLVGAEDIDALDELRLGGGGGGAVVVGNLPWLSASIFSMAGSR